MAASELTQRTWAIAESMGRPVPEHRKVYEAICDEMMVVDIERHWALAIAGYVSAWRKDRNRYQLDLAFMILHQLGGKPTETMLQEDFRARRLGFDGPLSGTADSIKNDNAEWAALMVMTNLIIRGMGLAEASKKAASYYAIRYPNQKQKKASSLESYYTKMVRNTGIEDRMLELQKDRPVPEWDEQWNSIADLIPDCPSNLIGSRRR